MNSSLKRVFTRDEKKKILSYTLDNLGQAAFQGALLGMGTTFILRSRLIGLIAFSYMLGKSLRESNDYIFENFK